MPLSTKDKKSRVSVNDRGWKLYESAAAKMDDEKLRALTIWADAVTQQISEILGDMSQMARILRRAYADRTRSEAIGLVLPEKRAPLPMNLSS